MDRTATCRKCGETYEIGAETAELMGTYKTYLVCHEDETPLVLDPLDHAPVCDDGDPPSIGSIVTMGLVAGAETPEILNAVLLRHPAAKVTPQSVSWYRHHFNNGRLSETGSVIK